MDFSKINKVHIIGIGGIGVSAVAKIFLALGKQVSGSDIQESDLTLNLAKRGVAITYGHQAGNITPDVDLVVYSPAVEETNPEREQTVLFNIEQKSYPEFLGVYSHDKKTIAISGTNGKSTTTAMLGKIFEKAGLDPTIIVGTQVQGFDGNFRQGSSEWLILEACEWKGHMLNLLPQTIILTNLEPDHLDYYKDLDDLKHAFQKYINSLPINGGFLAFNADDPALQSLTKSKGYKVKTWSIHNNADFVATELANKKQKQLFKILNHPFSLKIPGLFNVYNALAAITVAKEAGIDWKIIKESLAEFSGSWRRFELVGKLKGQKDILVVSDYAHHPTALKGTLKAAKEFYPERRLVALFQPHHFDRTAKLFDDFVKSFDYVDQLIISEVYDVAGRQSDGVRSVGSTEMVAAIKARHPFKEITYAADLPIAQKYLLDQVKPNDLVLIMGAGDVDQVARNIVH
ncbi:MAG: UDP-N-acetylmuramate--L-alanine ligase [Patescibacteria group bacterium]|jgi:UDP-N-acetylmuramate--alanine ligase